MNLENLNNNDLKNIIDLFLLESDQVFFLVNQQFKVVEANNAMSKFVQKEISDIIDSDFGDVLGCGNMYKESKFCAFTSFCKLCEIRNNLHHTFNRTKDIVEFELVREYLIRGEKVIRHLQFKIIPITVNKESLAACFIKDLKDKNDLMMLLNPNESV